MYDGPRKKTKKSMKKNTTLAAGSVLTDVHLSKEVIKLRSVIREARFFFTQRLIRRIKKIEVQLAKKPKDTLKRKVKRLQEELHAVKTIPMDDVYKFVLSNKNTLDQLKVSSETPANERCLYKLSRGPRVIKAVMEYSEVRCNFEMCGKSDKEMEQTRIYPSKKILNVASSSNSLKEPKKRKCPEKSGAASLPAKVAGSEIGASAIVKRIRLDKAESIEIEKNPVVIPQITSQGPTEDTDAGSFTFFLPYSEPSNISSQSTITSMRPSPLKSEHPKESNKGKMRKKDDRKSLNGVQSSQSKQESSGTAHKARENIGELHPSWAARKRAKELQQLAPKGKRIVFSDD
ncbi:hypothetical protein KIN20_030695 [Parelaphostrongylus tenuis]|uniref:Serum response factor-binding protein 1 n=1 Tax=Parelaphostrongylus tenuis TaxID=148309 RepID=A0AAD5WGH9_PARTN|nr:hypothetical protein KIN20_030695 [Parelaphostrongylus tenuis]